MEKTVEPQILICGNDADLLETRVLVLKSAGMSAESVAGLTQLKRFPHQNNIHLTVVCHSFDEREREEAVSYISQALPESKTLVLTVGFHGTPKRALAALNTLEGPEKFVAAVKRLLA